MRKGVLPHEDLFSLAELSFYYAEHGGGKPHFLAATIYALRVSLSGRPTRRAGSFRLALPRRRGPLQSSVDRGVQVGSRRSSGDRGRDPRSAVRPDPGRIRRAAAALGQPPTSPIRACGGVRSRRLPQSLPAARHRGATRCGHPADRPERAGAKLRRRPERARSRDRTPASADLTRSDPGRIADRRTGASSLDRRTARRDRWSLRAARAGADGGSRTGGRQVASVDHGARPLSRRSDADAGDGPDLGRPASHIDGAESPSCSCTAPRRTSASG